MGRYRWSTDSKKRKGIGGRVKSNRQKGKEAKEYLQKFLKNKNL